MTSTPVFAVNLAPTLPKTSIRVAAAATVNLLAAGGWRCPLQALRNVAQNNIQQVWRNDIDRCAHYMLSSERDVVEVFPHDAIGYTLQIPGDTVTKQLALFLTFCLSASSIWAQVGAALSGTVSDQSHALVSAATVTVKNLDTGAIRGTATDSSGRYQV